MLLTQDIENDAFKNTKYTEKRLRHEKQRKMVGLTCHTLCEKSKGESGDV